MAALNAITLHRNGYAIGRKRGQDQLGIHNQHHTSAVTSPALSGDVVNGLLSAKQLVPGALSATTSDVLNAVLRSNIEIAIWSRKLSPALQLRMANFSILMPRYQSFVLPPQEEAAPMVDRALEGFYGSVISGIDDWRNDLMCLVQMARSIVSQATLRVRIESKSCNDRPVFHVDQLPLRLVCTYRGHGTQWLAEPASGCRDEAESHDGKVYELACGEVAVMKGACFPGQLHGGLKHRTPPASVEFPRVLVVMDIQLP